MADYIPDNDARFDEWFAFLIQYVAAKCSGEAPEWTHIPNAAWTDLSNLYGAWHTAWLKTIGPHTQVDTEVKNNTKKEAKKVIRPFVNQYLRFPPVLDSDRTAMRIPNRDPHPTPVPVPEDVPEVEVVLPLPRVLQFKFRRANAKRWGEAAQGTRDGVPLEAGGDGRGAAQ